MSIIHLKGAKRPYGTLLLRLLKFLQGVDSAGPWPASEAPPVQQPRQDAGGRSDDASAPLPPPEVPLPPEPYVDPEHVKSQEEADRNLQRRVTRNLREGAQSILHLMNHKPRNPYCEACVRAKMTQVRTYCGAHAKITEYWGHEITADHITSVEDNILGITGDRNALIIKDAFSGLKEHLPSKDEERRGDSYEDYGILL